MFFKSIPITIASSQFPIDNSLNAISKILIEDWLCLESSDIDGPLKPHKNATLSAISKFKDDQERARQIRLNSGFATPREKFEQERFDPDDWERINESVQSLRQPEPPTQSNIPYDIHDCPLDPPKNYPYTWSVMSVLENWNPITKAIKMVKSEKTGAYTFVESIMAPDQVNDWLKK